MDIKLTLRLNKKVIERAKNYAQNQKISLSKIIESYLNSITKQKTGETEITPLVKSLSGVIELPDNYDHKKEYYDHLTEKYK